MDIGARGELYCSLPNHCGVGCCRCQLLTTNLPPGLLGTTSNLSLVLGSLVASFMLSSYSSYEAYSSLPQVVDECSFDLISPLWTTRINFPSIGSPMQRYWPHPWPVPLVCFCCSGPSMDAPLSQQRDDPDEDQYLRNPKLQHDTPTGYPKLLTQIRSCFEHDDVRRT